jgi:20S proteasome alpha/beta subunit
MTVVVACRFLKTATIFADCRVSYANSQAKDVDDNLQKIYQIGDKMVIGFSGPLSGAFQVMEVLRKNLKTYSKPPVASNLQRDVERWIRYEYQQIKEEERKNLSFILVLLTYRYPPTDNLPSLSNVNRT